jgi:hypothetical protein
MPDENQSVQKFQAEEAKKLSAWNRLRTRANAGASIAVLFGFLVVFGAVAGYFFAASKKPAPAQKSENIESLTPTQISQLSQVGTSLGTSNQTLNIGANTLFRGNENVVGTLSVGGSFNANGPVTLSQLNITGNSALTGLNVGSNLAVSGTTSLKGALTVSSAATVSSLTVTGNASIGALGANSIAVHDISISGPLTVSHLVTQGPTPDLTNYLGGASNANISGNDTSGQLNINLATSPSGPLVRVNFKAAYSNTVHVQITALTADAAKAGVYVIPSSTGFTVEAATPSGNTNLQLDYLVTQ